MKINFLRPPQSNCQALIPRKETGPLAAINVWPPRRIFGKHQKVFVFTIGPAAGDIGYTGTTGRCLVFTKEHIVNKYQYKINNCIFICTIHECNTK